jgi:hypothetical protein
LQPRRLARKGKRLRRAGLRPAGFSGDGVGTDSACNS